MSDKKPAGKYELDEITIRKAENGFVVRSSQKLTQEARAEQEKSERKSKGATAPSLEYYKSEEFVAESKESALKRVSSELDEYSNSSSEELSEESIASSNDGDVRAGGIGFR